jgi:hypothetical protein
MGTEFEIFSSALGSFVGMIIHRDRMQCKIYLSQPDYTEKIIKLSKWQQHGGGGRGRRKKPE